MIVEASKRSLISDLSVLTALPIAPAVVTAAVAEAPLRCVAVAAQTFSRLWVRNGLSFASQVHNYVYNMSNLVGVPVSSLFTPPSPPPSPPKVIAA